VLSTVEFNKKNRKETAELQAQWLMAYPWPFDEFLLIFQGSPNLFGNPFQKNIKSVIILFDVPINLPSVCISIALLVNLQIQSQSI